MMFANVALLHPLPLRLHRSPFPSPSACFSPLTTTNTLSHLHQSTPQILQSFHAFERLREIDVYEDLIKHLQSGNPSSVQEEGSVEKMKVLLGEGISAKQLNLFLRKCQVHGDRYFLNIPLHRLESVLAFLKNIHVEKQNLGRVLIHQPNLLERRVESLERKLWLLQSLGMAPQDVGKCVVRHPRIFLYSLPSLKQRIHFWQSLGVNDEHICKMIRNYPETLGLSLENISRKLDFLQQLGLERNSKEIMVAYCKIASCSSKSLCVRLHSLTSRGFSMDEAKQIVRRWPAILALKPENSEDTLDYILNVVKRDPKDILTFPQCITYSLEKRIKPRFASLAQRQGQYRLTVNSSLSCILACTDDVFQKRLLSKNKKHQITSCSI